MAVLTYKSPDDLEAMREAGRVVAKVLDLLARMIAPGITTGELDIAAEQVIRSYNAIPLFLNYPSSSFGIRPFPASICASVNEEVVHGIPSDRILKEGDIISVDVGAKLNGWCGDAARTFPVGAISRRARRLIEITQSSLNKAIQTLKPGNTLGNVSYSVQHEAESNGFSVVKQFVGHGIGKEMHEPPQVPNFVCSKGESLRGASPDFVLQKGLVLAIEPMVNIGASDVIVDRGNGWTVRTKDRCLSAHFEHTVAVTDKSFYILTEL